MVANGTQQSMYGDTIGFNEPYLLSTSAGSALVPAYLDIVVGGHPYKAETSFTPFKQDAYRSDSIQAVADKLDTNNIQGESSVNNQGLWRRGMIDFSKGSGQKFLDRQGSDDARFLASKGIDPWIQWQASLLADTAAVHSSGTELQVIVVGSFVYINDNGTVRVSTGNLSSWTALTGVTAATTTAALATDGVHLYIAAVSNGIYLVNTALSSTTNAQWITGTVNFVWYAGAQLMCAAGAALYNVTTSTGAAGPTALPTALYTQPNASFVWSSCAAGNSWVYLGGYTGNANANASFIYKTQMNGSGTALIVPITAASLPGGEVVWSLFAYSNYIMVGTSLGARFCETLGLNDPGGNAGDLKMGPIVPDQIQQVSKPVKCFTGQFRFIWFGWSNYDVLSTGLGRMDLSTFIDQQAPAYTSDLMVSGAGEVVSMDWYNGANTMKNLLQGSPIFVVFGKGVYTCAPTYVPSGVIDSGYITYGIPDDKLARLFDFTASGTTGSLSASINVDNGSASYSLASQSLSNQLQEISLPTTLKGELFDVQTIINAGSSNTVSPTVTRWLMKSLACVVSGTIHKCIINLFASEETGGVDQVFDPYLEFNFLDGLRQSQTPVQYVEGTELNVTVVVRNVTRLIYSGRGGPSGGFNQRIELDLMTLEN